MVRIKSQFVLWSAAVFVAAGLLPLGAQANKAARAGKANSHEISIGNAQVHIQFHRHSGTMDISWTDGHQLLGIASSATLVDGRTLSTDQYPDHELQIPEGDSAPGHEHEYIIRSSGNGLPVLSQHVRLYDNKPWLSIQAELDSEGSRVGTRHFDTVLIRRDDPVQIGPGAVLRVLHVPFDNDMWFRFASIPVSAIKDDVVASGEEVTTIYDNASRQGLVIGSITHDTWKTAIDVKALHGRLATLDVYGGISAPNGVRSDTHDTVPHGIVHGDKVLSPRIFIGSFSDWRDGLETYGKANAEIQPPLRWPEGVPAGWNSWAAYGGKIDYERYLGAAQFVRDTLSPEGFGRGKIIYINLDAFWSRLDAVQLDDAVANIKAMKSSGGTPFQVGIYWTPFAYWSDNLDAFVEGTGMRYRYRDILLKAPDGSFLPKVDGGRPIDPSHPGAKERAAFYVKEFRRLGFTYLKIDFLSHGALEGVHYDPAIQTGTEAYNLGMKQIVDEAGGKMFLSLSIAPLFPSGYGHARRLSCDTKGHINGKEQSTEYMLNALAYGWWTNKALYILDPDHVVLGERGDQGARNLDEGNSRLLSAVISGGMVLDSSPVADDVQARGLAKDVYNKPEWFQIASGGDAFRPIEGDTGDSAANAFVRASGNEWYLAVFNYDDKNPTTIHVPVARILPAHTKGELSLVDPETHSTAAVAGGMVTVTLRPAESKLLTLTFRAQP